MIMQKKVSFFCIKAVERQTFDYDSQKPHHDSEHMSIHPDPNINRLNVLGEPSASCCYSPITGYFRNGFCHTATTDLGQHTICAQMTAEFLNFSQKVGNVLITPLPEVDFPGLEPGDFWCICVTRWVDAYQAGIAPPIKIQACHQAVLSYVPLDVLMEYAV